MKNPLITMSAVTGKPARTQIFDYLKSLSDNGIGGAMLYPRSGCELDYLSDEWFSAVGAFIDGAEALGLDIWLYDDFNWPSGDAGGRITQNEHLRLRSIRISGKNKGQISCASTNHGSLFAEKYFADLLSDEATDLFIKLTHEEYYRRFGKYFGNVIKGIFTDEPAVGYACDEGTVPYYDGLDNDYRDRYASELRSDIDEEKPELAARISELVGERFGKTYTGKLAKWCESHGIALTGHLMCDDSPLGSTRQSGNYLKNLKNITVPGIDEIYTDIGGDPTLSLFGAAEYASGENGAMAELFALGPSDMSYAKKNCMIHLGAAFKIDKYFLAVSGLDMRGNALITDFFHPVTDDQPDFCGMRLFSEKAKRAAYLATLDYRADVYIRYPVRASAEALVRTCDVTRFYELINRLSSYGIQWKYITDEAPADAPIIEFDYGYSISINGKRKSIESVIESLGVPPAVTLTDGSIASGIFVRKYDDGNALVLNLAGEAGEYVVLGKKTYLEKYAVQEFSSLVQNRNIDYLKFTTDRLSIKYNNPNMTRIMYINREKQAKLVCDCDMTVRFAVRYGEEAYINGERISAKHDGREFLSRGMRELYRVSESLKLIRGEYNVSANNDFKYLPTVLVLGEFSAEHSSSDVCTLKLSKRESEVMTGDRINTLGSVELSTVADIPECAREIEIISAAVYTKVWIGTECIGEGIIPPFRFLIPEEMKGQNTVLKIEHRSSIAPLFGDVDYFDKATREVKWRGTPAPTDTDLGVAEIRLLI